MGRRWGLPTFAAAIAAAAGLWVFLGTHRNSAPGGCVFPDGGSYCAMAGGHKGYSPFSRRVLAPGLVRVLHLSTIANRFEFVDLLSIAVAASALFLIARVVAGQLAPGRATPAAILAVGIYLASPYVLRLTKFAPVLIDEPAVALGLLTLLSLLRGRRWLIAAPVLAAATVFTRESWMVPLVLAAVVLAWLTSERAAAIGVTVGAVLAGAVATMAPHLGAQLSPFTVARQRVEYYLHPHGLVELVYQLGFAVGLIPLVVIAWWIGARPNFRTVWPAAVLIAASAGHVVQGVIGGSDVGRIAFPAVVLLLPVAAAAIMTTPNREFLGFGTACLILTIVEWQPWTRLRGVDPQYRNLYYYTGHRQLPYVALLALGLLGLVAAGVRLRSTVRASTT